MAKSKAQVSPKPQDAALTRKRVYRERRNETGLNRPQWGRLFQLGDSKNASQLVYRKECEASEGKSHPLKVNKAEALAAELLTLLHRKGFDLNSIEFDDEGTITGIAKLRP